MNGAKDRECRTGLYAVKDDDLKERGEILEGVSTGMTERVQKSVRNANNTAKDSVVQLKRSDGERRGKSRPLRQEYTKKTEIGQRGKLKAVLQREVTGAKLVVEYPDYYEEDYQMPMLRENHLKHILGIKTNGVGNTTYFSYETAGMLSMQALFEKDKISCEELKQFLMQFLNAVDTIRLYMLNPDCLWLEPEYIFHGENGYYFCYVPIEPKPLDEQFHRLTEFFVRQIDYADTECICLAHKLNQGSMEEQYDVSVLLKQYEEEAIKRMEESVQKEAETLAAGEGNLFYIQDEIQETDPDGWGKTCKDVNTVREMGSFQNSVQRAVSRIKKKRWGRWQDLILESDGQEPGGV